MLRSSSSWPLVGVIAAAISAVVEGADFVAYNASTTETTAFWEDLVPMFTNASNVASASLDLTLAGMSSPNMTDSASMTGYDWTQPWPGSSIDGHGANLRVAFDISMPSDVVQDAASNIAALTFPVPESMAGAAMDPSWFICRHFFVGTPNIAAPDHTCSFLGEQCIDDLKTNLTANWMTADNSTYCGALAFDPIPNSCIDAFGYTTMDVISFDADTLAMDGEAELLASDNVVKNTYMIGTGYGYIDSSSRRESAANRTYLIADVWGYSDSVAAADRRTPDVSIACLTPVIEAGSVLNDTTASSSTVVATPTTSAVNTTVPAPTQTGIVDGCNEWYVAVAGDHCEAIVMDYDLTLDIFLEWNPAVGENCTNLLAGDAYCVDIPGYSRATGEISTIVSATPTATTLVNSASTVKSTTSTTVSTATGVVTPSPVQTGMADDCNDFYLVQAGDGCWAIANDEGITLDDFYAWNPAVGDDCSGLQADVYVCIGISGGDTDTTTAASPTLTATSTATTATAAVPSPTQSGIASNCDSYSLAGSGDYCYAFAENNGITTDELYEWNTILGDDGADCSSEFWSGYYYCVGVSS